jgi:hypothetical protein
MGFKETLGRVQDEDKCWVVVDAIMILRVPKNGRNFVTRCAGSSSRKTLPHGVKE